MLDLDYRNKQQQSYFDFGGFPDYRDADLDMWSFSPRAQLPFETGESRTLIVGVDFSGGITRCAPRMPRPTSARRSIM